MVRRVLARALRAAQHEVIEAENGLQAAALVAEQRFDAIVSDVTMPDMDGVALLRRIREHDRDVPVVLVTGRPDLASATQAVAFGAFNYLMKPVDADSLRDVVRRAVDLHRIARMKQEAFAIVQGMAGVGEIAALESSFEHALETLWIAFQPIVFADGKGLYGYEGFLRTNEPTLPHPGAVLDAAERLRRLHDLGCRVRDGVAQNLDRVPGFDFDVFVNLHPHDLLDERLFDANAALSRYARRIVLEITERCSLHEVPDIRTRIGRLRDLGFRVAIDDLGAGYAGLNSFAQLEPDIVKLDMVLVRDIHTSQTRQRLVASMTSLCKSMGMLVVAEGVESLAERDTLTALGCDLFQGYLFAHPAKAFPPWSWYGPTMPIPT